MGCKKIIARLGEATVAGATIPILNNFLDTIRTLNSSKIDIGEWEDSFEKINKLLFKLNPRMYLRNRVPTVNKEMYRLTKNTSYIIKLKDKNYLRVWAYVSSSESGLWSEQRLELSFYGSHKYQNRTNFLINSLKLTDDKRIPVKLLKLYGSTIDIMPHDFNTVVMKPDMRARLIDGLNTWRKSKKWYADHQLVHKIGILLYGKPGTGKSSVAKAISTMFNNAPILIFDSSNIIDSINRTIKMRKMYAGEIIVLIEDFDQLFEKRDDNEAQDTTVGSDQLKPSKIKNVSMLENTNAIFQVLDGVYSMDGMIYIATTNYIEKLDAALIRYGRFDLQEELPYFDREMTDQFIEMMGYNSSIADELNLEYPVQPAMLQSKIMEYRSKIMKKKIINEERWTQQVCPSLLF